MKTISAAALALAFACASHAQSPSPSATSAQIRGITAVNGPNLTVGQMVTLRIDGGGTGCGMQGRWGVRQGTNQPTLGSPFMNATPDFWGRQFNVGPVKEPGTFVFSVQGMQTPQSPTACQGQAETTVTVAAPAAGRISGITVVNAANLRVGQTVTLRVDGSGIGCGLRGWWGIPQGGRDPVLGGPLMNADKAAWWGRQFNINGFRNPGTYTFRVAGATTPQSPTACEGQAEASVTVAR